MNTFKYYRLMAGLRQAEVAECLGVSQTTVSMWETGENHPRAELLPKIAALYNCTIDELLTQDPTNM